MMKIHEGLKGAGGNYEEDVLSRLLTLRASAIKWQSTETPSPLYSDSKMSHEYRPPATRAAAAACTQE